MSCLPGGGGILEGEVRARGGGEGILEYRGRGSENSDSGRTSSMDAPLGGILDRYHAKSLIFYL